MYINNPYFLLIFFSFSLLFTGCATSNSSQSTGIDDDIAILALRDTPVFDVTKDGHKIYYKTLESDFKCLIRVTEGPIYQKIGKYDEALFICLAQNQQDGLWDVIRFRHPSGQRESTKYRYRSEQAAFKAVVPLIYW